MSDNKKAVLAISLGLLAIFLSLGLINLAHAEGKWERLGIAPYASSLEEACTKGPEAITRFNMPKAVKDHFIAEIKKDCGIGETVWLTPDMRLKQMWSGGSEPKIMDDMTMAELPVPKSADGRDYPEGSVAETAKAYVWMYEFEGILYKLYLPLVCFNWSWGADTPYGACPVILVHVREGDSALQFILLGGTPSMSRECPFGYQRPDSKNLFALPTECPHGPCDFSDTIRASRLLAGPSGGVDVSNNPGWYQFQVSEEFAQDQNRIAAFCVTNASGEHSCAKDIHPEDYANGVVASIGYAEDKSEERTLMRVWCFPTLGPCSECR